MRTPSPTTAEVEILPSRSSRRRDGVTKRRSRRRRRLIVALLIVVALLGSAVAAGALFVHDVVGGNLTTIADDTAFPSGKRPAASTGAKNILLIGSDSRRPDLEGRSGNQRADTIMLLNVSADRQHVAVMSILRDLWVPVPGHGETKVNAALAHGGTALLIETLEDLLGARIGHVAIIDFSGLSAMTTALGGVVVDNPTPFTASRGEDRFFAAGPITLEGDRALTFARERYAFSTGDYQRVTNQQLLLQGIVSRALSRDVLADPASLVEFVRETSRTVTVDAGFTLRESGALAYSLRGADLKNFDFFTLPTGGTGMVGTQSIVKVDPAATSKVRAALAADTLADYARGLAE